jgi:hypothetical protein
MCKVTTRHKQQEKHENVMYQRGVFMIKGKLIEIVDNLLASSSRATSS